MFDFNDSPARLYGIWPQTPFPVEVSIYGYCQMSCGYCFANLNRDAAGREVHKANPTEKLLRQLDRWMADDMDPIGYFLRERYPVCFSNTTDPFQREEKAHRASEAFLSWAKANRVPVFLQTRGNVLLEEFDRYAPLLVPGKDVAYVSLETLDDKLGRKLAPGAMPPSDRLALMRRLTDRGIPVIAACNPYLKEWVGGIAGYCEAVAKAGCRGVWLEALHFTAAQAGELPRARRDWIAKANLHPMYMIGQLKEWYAATADCGLDFYPTPKWDAYFQHPAKAPECAMPEWFGGKTFHWAFSLIKEISDLSWSNGRAKVIVFWQWVEKWLEANGCPNPVLSVSKFWNPYNASIKADHREWKATLGDEAPLYEILRYFWNHHWDSQNFLWYHPYLRALKFNEDDADKAYQCDERGDLIGVFDSSIKHHGSKYIYQDELAGAYRWKVHSRKGELCPLEVEAGTPRQPRSDDPACEGASPRESQQGQVAATGQPPTA